MSKTFAELISENSEALSVNHSAMLKGFIKIIEQDPDFVNREWSTLYRVDRFSQILVKNGLLDAVTDPNNIVECLATIEADSIEAFSHLIRHGRISETHLKLYLNRATPEFAERQLKHWLFSSFKGRDPQLEVLDGIKSRWVAWRMCGETLGKIVREDQHVFRQYLEQFKPTWDDVEAMGPILTECNLKVIDTMRIKYSRHRHWNDTYNRFIAFLRNTNFHTDDILLMVNNLDLKRKELRIFFDGKITVELFDTLREKYGKVPWSAIVKNSRVDAQILEDNYKMMNWKSASVENLAKLSENTKIALQLMGKL